MGLSPAFNLQGPTPQQTPMLPGLGGGSTPAAVALSGGTLPKPQLVSSLGSSQNTKPFLGGTLSLGNNIGTVPGLLAGGHPNLASQTVTGSDGTTVKQTYNTDNQSSDTSGSGSTSGTSGTSGTGTSGTTGTTGGNPYIAPTAAAATQQGQIAQQEQAIKDQYSSAIAGLLPQIRSEAGDLTTGTAPVASGNANVAAQTAAAETGQLQSAETAALAPLQAAQTATAGETAGLQGAATTAQASGTFPFVFNPTTNQFTVSGAAPLQTAISGGVQQAVANPTLYSSLESAIADTYGTAAAGMFQQAYISAGGNPAVAAGQATGAQAVAAAGGQTEAQNIQTAGTAATSAASTAYQSAVQSLKTANQSYSSLTGVSAQLNDTLSTWTQNGQLTNVNTAINKIASLTSDPNYQKFVSALANTQAAYASALGSSGVIPTQATQDALAVLNPSSSATAINAALNQLSKDAFSLLVTPAQQQQDYYAKQLGIQ